MAWRLQINFDDGTSELVDDLFETEEDAMWEFQMWLDSWNEGRDTLELAGEDFCSKGIRDCDVYEEE